MDNIISLVPKAPKEEGPTENQQEVIDFVEHLVVLAKEGSIKALAIAFVHSDGHTGSGYHGAGELPKLLGATEILKKGLLDHFE